MEKPYNKKICNFYPSADVINVTIQGTWVGWSISHAWGDCKCNKSVLYRIERPVICLGSRRWPSWLRHCATSRKVAGSIPDGVIGFLIYLILPAALWTWGRLSVKKNEHQAISPGGKGGRCVGLTTLPPSCAKRVEVLGTSISWSPCPGLHLDGFTNSIMKCFFFKCRIYCSDKYKQHTLCGYRIVPLWQPFHNRIYTI
jgi:hypothetical protein